MIPDEVLKEHGYRGHAIRESSIHNHSDYLFQKRFRDGDTTLYFVNVWQYYPKKEYPSNYLGGSMVEAQLYPDENRDEWVTLTINGSSDLDYVEDFIRNAYQKLEMVPDIHNQ